VVKKVREVKNVAEQYNQIKQQKGRNSLSKQTLVSSNSDPKRLAGSLGEKGQQRELVALRRKLSNEAHDVDIEEEKVMRSLNDVQMQRRDQQRSLVYQVAGVYFDTDMPSSSTNTLGMRFIKSPDVPQQLQCRMAGVSEVMNLADENDDELSSEQRDEDDVLQEEDRRLLQDVKIEPDDAVIVASFKLPISVEKDPNIPGEWRTRPSRSLLYSTMFKLREKKKMVRIHWIGWPGVIPETTEEAQQITELLKPFGCIPVFFDAETVDQFLYFHETVLRPLFHNFKGLNDFEYDLGKQEHWQKYQLVNGKFAATITELKQEREMVWVNDNQLLLVPKYVFRKDLNANIGFFLHSPFPSSDIYKMFPYRAEVLKSLLSCNLIGFHLFEYARNFYTACRRILGLNHEFKKGGFLAIESFGRSVMIRISHIGVMEEDIVEATEKETYLAFVKQLQTQLVQKKRNVLASIDRLHPISGLKNKFLAYQRFLRDYPQHRAATTLVQYVVPSEWPSLTPNSGTQLIINQTKSDIYDLIREIEEEFGKSSISYVEHDLTLEQRMGLWASANILLITTLRDGQCLPPLEFITVRKHQGKASKTAVILSEFSGCNRALGGVLRINPFNVEEISKNIAAAITMQPEEREQRFKIAYNYISKHSTLKWAEAFLKDMKRSHQPLGDGLNKYMIIGFGLNQTIIKTRQGFKELKESYVEGNYNRSCNRLVIIDQEGVLPMNSKPVRTAPGQSVLEPQAKVIKVLNEIISDERNTVVVISS